MPETAYRLIRTTPGGQEYTQEPISTIRQACMYAGYVLRDNALVGKTEAGLFAGRLNKLPLGETATHEGTGYKFRIEPIER